MIAVSSSACRVTRRACDVVASVLIKDKEQWYDHDRQTNNRRRQTFNSRMWPPAAAGHGRGTRLIHLARCPQSHEFGRKLVKLVASRANGEQPSTDLRQWVGGLPASTLRRLLRIGLVDSHRVAGARLLKEHISDFEVSLRARENTSSYVRLVVYRVNAVIDGCQFRHWTDIRASHVEAFLASRRSLPGGISAQTHNFYLAAFKQFCSWMVRDGRAEASPVRHLSGINVSTDRRHDRRPLSSDEIVWLLHVTEEGPTRAGVTGRDRSLLYRLATETGLRASELRSLTAASFALDAQPPCLVVAAAYSKHRKQDLIVLRSETAALLKKHVASRPAEAVALAMPSRTRLARVLRQDLHDARMAWLRPQQPGVEERERADFLLYKNRQGRFADFHAFRHATGTFLAAAGVSPKVAQAIMRHSDYRLTMNVYSHSSQDAETAAVAQLPDLAKRPPKESCEHVTRE